MVVQIVNGQVVCSVGGSRREGRLFLVCGQLMGGLIVSHEQRWFSQSQH